MKFSFLCFLQNEKNKKQFHKSKNEVLKDQYDSTAVFIVGWGEIFRELGYDVDNSHYDRDAT